MNDLFQTLSASASGMKAQAERLRFVSENIANADTPGYRRKTAGFHEVLEAGRLTGLVETGQVQLDQREAQRSYEANLKMFDQARQMSTRLLELLRR